MSHEPHVECQMIATPVERWSPVLSVSPSLWLNEIITTSTTVVTGTAWISENVHSHSQPDRQIDRSYSKENKHE